MSAQSIILYEYGEVLASMTSIGRAPLIVILYAFPALLHEPTIAAVTSFPLYKAVRSAMTGSNATCHILSSFIPDNVP